MFAWLMFFLVILKMKLANINVCGTKQAGYEVLVRVFKFFGEQIPQLAFCLEVSGNLSSLQFSSV